ncbi:GNAT family N-acetyltransferase [Sphingomonas sp.]|uniref:GNAT family N-acetyltransferase n=1 Tax=Sphingomonas sp. TaxID=28214 RepID=UPI0031DA259A
MTIAILDTDAQAVKDGIEPLIRILADSVDQGAAIGFMAPLSDADAARFWLEQVSPELAAGRRRMFVARYREELVGTVQLLTAMPANQPHRCEIAKMIVHPAARRLGIGRALMSHALHQARAIGKTLVTLDTRSGDAAQSLYASLGFEVAGAIPGYAWDADGRTRHATTFMFARI